MEQTEACSLCGANAALYPQRSNRRGPLRSIVGVALLVVSVPVVVCGLLALFALFANHSQPGLGDKDTAGLVVGVFGLLVATPVAIGGALLARGKLILVCAQCRSPQRK
jgi:hypothetical protein